jgi:hypothetical protein
VNGETRERLGQSAKRSAAIRGQAGRGPTVAWPTSAGCGRPETWDFLPARFCGRSRADLLRASRFLLHLHDPRERERKAQKISRPTDSKSIGSVSRGRWSFGSLEVVVLL